MNFDEERKIVRRDSFTLSMVDLFGCGFIAATFLFIFNMLQPQLDAAERSGSMAAQAERGSLGTGDGGPVLVAIRSTRPLADFEVPYTREGESYLYEYLLADSAAERWPYHRVLTPAVDAPAGDVTVRFTLGNQVATASVRGWSDAVPIDFSFSVDSGLRASVDRDFGHQVEVELLPRRPGNAAYVSRYAFFSDEVLLGAVSWLGDVDSIVLRRGDQPKLKAKMADRSADCSVVVQEQEIGDLVFCGATPPDWLLPDLSAEQSQSASVMLPGACVGGTLPAGAPCAATVEDICQRLGATTCGSLHDAMLIGGPA